MASPFHLSPLPTFPTWDTPHNPQLAGLRQQLMRLGPAARASARAHGGAAESHVQASEVIRGDPYD